MIDATDSKCLKNNFLRLQVTEKACSCINRRQYSNTGTSTLNKMFATDLIHSARVELNANASSHMPHENSV